MSSQFSAEEFKLSWDRKKTLTWASHSSPTVTSSQLKHRLILEERVLFKTPLSWHSSSLYPSSYHMFLCQNRLHSGRFIWLCTFTNTLGPTQGIEGKEPEFGEWLGVKEGGCETVPPWSCSKLLNYSYCPIHFSLEYILKLVKTQPSLFVALCSFCLVY